jgi:hypothetical protein
LVLVSAQHASSHTNLDESPSELGDGFCERGEERDAEQRVTESAKQDNDVGNASKTRGRERNETMLLAVHEQRARHRHFFGEKTTPQMSSVEVATAAAKRALRPVVKARLAAMTPEARLLESTAIARKASCVWSTHIPFNNFTSETNHTVGCGTPTVFGCAAGGVVPQHAQ